MAAKLGKEICLDGGENPAVNKAASAGAAVKEAKAASDVDKAASEAAPAVNKQVSEAGKAVNKAASQAGARRRHFRLPSEEFYDRFDFDPKSREFGKELRGCFERFVAALDKADAEEAEV